MAHACVAMLKPVRHAHASISMAPSTQRTEQWLMKTDPTAYMVDDDAGT